MDKRIEIDQIEISIEKKEIKNLYIRILPPDGTVKITAPKRMKDREIRDFVLSKIEWIKKHQEKYMEQEQAEEIQYRTGERHYLWGRCYYMQVIDSSEKGIRIQEESLILKVPHNSTLEERQLLMEKWYREQLRNVIPAVLSKCEKVVGKVSNECRIKNMKTRWGSCNPKEKRIWLNLQLAKKPPECLEYVITHELVHLYSRYHNQEFWGYMDQFYPNWREVRKKLNEG